MTGADNGCNDRRDEDMRGIVSLAVSPDGQFCATAADYCDIALWDAETKAHIATLEHTGHIPMAPAVWRQTLGQCTVHLLFYRSGYATRYRTVSSVRGCGQNISASIKTVDATVE